MMSDATEPPRCVWSSASPTSAGACPRSYAGSSHGDRAGDHLAERREPRRVDRVRHGETRRSTSTPAASRTSAASSPNRAGMTGSREPCATATGTPARRSGESASRRRAAGSPTCRSPRPGGGGPGRGSSPSSSPRPARPSTTRSIGTGRASRNAASWGGRVEGRRLGVGIPPRAYQCRPRAAARAGRPASRRGAGARGRAGRAAGRGRARPPPAGGGRALPRARPRARAGARRAPSRAGRPRARQRRQPLLDLVAEVLEGRRQDQRLAEVLRPRRSRTRAERGELEQHAGLGGSRPSGTRTGRSRASRARRTR